MLCKGRLSKPQCPIPVSLLKRRDKGIRFDMIKVLLLIFEQIIQNNNNKIGFYEDLCLLETK